MIDLIDKRFGRLIVLNHAGVNKHGSNIWNCKCDCGNIKTVTTAHLNNGHVKSCGCLKLNGACLPKGEATFNQHLVHYKQHAKRKKVKFELTKDEFKDLTSRNCFYCNEPPEYKDFFTTVRGKVYRKNGGAYLNGIDRIDSDKGYTLDNCVPCCTKCNLAKRTMSYEEFRNWIFKVHDYMKATEFMRNYENLNNYIDLSNMKEIQVQFDWTDVTVI